MAIRQMCKASDPGAVRDAYWSSEVTRQTGKPSDIYLATTHAGLVLELREHNMRDDSDFYAIVWNAEKGEPERVMYGSTRGWTYPNGASVDATPEVLAAHAAYEQRQRDAAIARRQRCEAMTPTKGKQVRFCRATTTKGTKIAKGDTGVVFWYGKAREFGSFPQGGYKAAARDARAWVDSMLPPVDGKREGFRVGVKLDTGVQVFTSATNVLVEVEVEAESAA